MSPVIGVTAADLTGLYSCISQLPSTGFLNTQNFLILHKSYKWFLYWLPLYNITGAFLIDNLIGREYLST